MRHRNGVAHVDDAVREPPGREGLLHQPGRAVVHRLGKHHVVAGTERLEDRASRRLSRRERERGRPALDGGKRRLERLTSGIQVTRVLEAAAELPIGIALERRREVNGRRHRPGRRIGLLP